VGPVSGSLLAGGILRGHQTIAAPASDTGGGLSAVSVLVNGLEGAPPVSGACALVSVSNRSTYGPVATSPTP